MKKIVFLTVFLMLFTMVGQFGVQEAKADEPGVTVVANLTSDPNYNGLLDGGGLDSFSTTTVRSEPEVGLSTTTLVFFSFKPIYEFTSTTPDTIDITLPATWTASDCNTASSTVSSTVDIDADGNEDGSFGFVSNVATYTMTTSTSIASTTGVEFCVAVLTDATPANGANVLITNGAATQGGAVLIYSGDDNDILVTATVYDDLYFALRDSTLDADTNVCALGTLDYANVHECEYRLAISTSAGNGFTAYVWDASSTPGLVNENSTEITKVIEDSTNVVAGTEGYGIEFTGATALTEAGDFSDDDTPIPASKTAMLTHTSGHTYSFADPTTSSLVTHKAAISASTEAGSYTQTVSYYLTANY